MGALMAFRVGQEVVCVKQLYEGLGDTFSSKVKINGIYHYAGDAGNFCGIADLIFLVEYPGLKFSKAAFRPIVKTDISIFEAMLAPSPKQRVDA